MGITIAIIGASLAVALSCVDKGKRLIIKKKKYFPRSFFPYQSRGRTTPR